MAVTVGNVLTLLGWVALLAYGVAWLSKYRAEPDEARELRATWMLGMAILLAGGAVLRWLGPEGFSKVLVANLAMSAFCAISWGQLKGYSQSKP